MKHINWNWSFYLCRLFGTDVRIHWSLPAIVLFFVLRAFRYGASFTFIGLFILLPYLLLFASVLAHEFGHVFAARRFYMNTGYIILTPIGGMVLVGPSRTPTAEFVVAMCGPLVNLILIALVMLIYLPLGGPFSFSLIIPFIPDSHFALLWHEQKLLLLILADFMAMQSILFFFNVLMIAYPLDGGRMLLAILWYYKGYRRALILSCQIAKILAIGLGIFGLLIGSIFLPIIAVFIWLQVGMLKRNAPYMTDPSIGYDSKMDKIAWNQQKGKTYKSHEPGFFTRWLQRDIEKKLEKLRRKIEEKGITALTQKERDFFQKYGG